MLDDPAFGALRSRLLSGRESVLGCSGFFLRVRLRDAAPGLMATVVHGPLGLYRKLMTAS